MSIKVCFLNCVLKTQVIKLNISKLICLSLTNITGLTVSVAAASAAALVGSSTSIALHTNICITTAGSGTNSYLNPQKN